jgi:ParB-like chromosome segregation protein Spo0J
MTVLIPIEKIKEGKQFFKPLDEESFSKLATSIRISGILQELIVRKAGDYYELLAGFNRLRVAKAIGLNEVPCKIVPEKDTANAIFDTDLFRRQLTKEEMQKLEKIKDDYKPKTKVNLVPELESIQKYLTPDVIELLSGLTLKTQELFLRALPEKSRIDETETKKMQKIIDDYEERLEEIENNKEQFDEVEKKYKQLKKEHEQLQKTNKEQLQKAINQKIEEIEKESATKSQMEIDALIEKEKKLLEQKYEKDIKELEKNVKKFSKLSAENKDKLSSLEEEKKKLGKEKKEAEADAEKHFLEKKDMEGLIKQLLSAETLTKKVDAASVQGRFIIENLTGLYDALVRIGVEGIDNYRESLKKQVNEVAKVSNNLTQVIKKIEEFLK